MPGDERGLDAAHRLGLGGEGLGPDLIASGTVGTGPGPGGALSVPGSAPGLPVHPARGSGAPRAESDARSRRVAGRAISTSPAVGVRSSVAASPPCSPASPPAAAPSSAPRRSVAPSSSDAASSTQPRHTYACEGPATSAPTSREGRQQKLHHASSAGIGQRRRPLEQRPIDARERLRIRGLTAPVDPAPGRLLHPARPGPGRRPSRSTWRRIWAARASCPVDS